MVRSRRHTRILLVQENRYQALLCRRELGSVLPNAVVAVYSHPGDALMEISHIPYDLAIVDTAMRSLPARQFLEDLRQVDAGLPLIILVEPGAETPLMRTSDNSVTVLVKEANYHRLLPAAVTKSPHREPTSSVAYDDDELTDLYHDVDAIVANLENDINNPLMAILGATELISGDGEGLSPEVKQKVEIIRTSALRIQNVLTTFSRTSRVH
ncbi:hypothetical protein KQH82_01715 [bacterium]|nr:hypothetical protein [bacterium]